MGPAVNFGKASEQGGISWKDEQEKLSEEKEMPLQLRARPATGCRQDSEACRSGSP
jgi:hypothetical protein